MAMDPAIKTALEEVLAEAVDQSPEFKQQFTRLVTLVLEGNVDSGDVRRVMETIRVSQELED